ncbi:MAG: class F sortase [Dehalococcoidia bacterium]|nr:class F sortase [Dehalococcoidia bacterium]
MTAITSIVRRLTDPFRWRRSRLTLAGVLLLASMVLLGAGLAGLLMTGESGATTTNIGDIPIYSGLNSPTTTPLPTPPPNNSPMARMIIEKIDVDAPIIAIGMDANNVPQVPGGPYDVGWYDWSSKPGWGGNAVFSGHVDWTVNGQPVIGVFYYLRDLGLDDVIKIVLEDGTEYRYKVTGNQAIEADDPRALQWMGPTPMDAATLITCGGTWIRDPNDPLGGHYTMRQVARAELIQEKPLGPIGAVP